MFSGIARVWGCDGLRAGGGGGSGVQRLAGWHGLRRVITRAGDIPLGLMLDGYGECLYDKGVSGDAI